MVGYDEAHVGSSLAFRQQHDSLCRTMLILSKPLDFGPEGIFWFCDKFGVVCHVYRWTDWTFGLVWVGLAWLALV